MPQEQQEEGEVGRGLESLLFLRSWESGNLQACVRIYHSLHSKKSCILAKLAVHEPGKPAFLHTSLQQQRDRQQKAFWETIISFTKEKSLVAKNEWHGFRPPYGKY